MGDESKSYSDIVSRRRFIEITGISGTAALAGCSGGGSDSSGDGGSSGDNETSGGDEGGNGSSNNSTGSGGQVYDAQHISYTNQVPTNMQWNTSNPSSFAQFSPDLIFDPFAKYNFSKSEFIPVGMSEWAHNGDSFEMTIRDGLTWSNGNDVTAEDIATQLRLSLYTGSGFADYTEEITEVDEKTVRLNFQSEINQRIAEFEILPTNWISQPKQVFGKYLEEIEKNEQKGVRSLQEFAWKEPVSSGPWTISNASPKQLLLERREGHPDSNNINFRQFTLRYLGSGEAAYQALTNQQIDSAFTQYAPPRIVKQYPDTVKQIQTPAAWGFGLVPNHSHRHAGDRAVRQAIQYVINREQAVNNVSKSSKQAPQVPTGISSNSQKQWLGNAMSDFETYGVDSSQTKKATSVLEEAGYTKPDGKWKDSDGKTVNLPIMVPSGWPDWNTAAQTVVDQLSSFGFETLIDAREFGTLVGNTWPKGDFVLTAGGWLASAPAGAYPYFSLRHQLITNSRGFAYSYPPASEQRGGSLADVTVPSRTGSGTMTVNPNKRISEMASDAGQSAIEEITVEQAWVANQDLPMIPVMEKLEQTFITDDNRWQVPDPDADVAQVHYANSWLPRRGKMQYSGN